MFISNLRVKTKIALAIGILSVLLIAVGAVGVRGMGTPVMDKEALLALYDFPAEHWGHIRTTNPIESSFATIRHRTERTKGAVSRSTLLGLVYKLAMCAEKSFRRLNGFEQLAEVIRGVKFVDRVPEASKKEHQKIAA